MLARKRLAEGQRAGRRLGGGAELVLGGMVLCSAVWSKESHGMFIGLMLLPPMTNDLISSSELAKSSLVDSETPKPSLALGLRMTTWAGKVEKLI